MIRNNNINDRRFLDRFDHPREGKFQDFPNEKIESHSKETLEILSNEELIRWTRDSYENNQHILYQLEGIAKREKILRDYYEGVKEKMGIKALMEIKVLPPFLNGYYNPEENRIVISAELVQHIEFETAIQTILHESRHAYQFMCVQNRELSKESRETLDTWQNNINNYVDASEDFEDYYKQPIERDARDFSEQIINHILNK